MNTHDRIERVPLTVSEKFLTVLSLLWVSLRYHFIGRNIENTHEKRTVRYKSQLICIYICHQFFFIHTSRIKLSSVRALKWKVFWNTCVLVRGPLLAFTFKTNTTYAPVDRKRHSRKQIKSYRIVMDHSSAKLGSLLNDIDGNSNASGKNE